MKKKWFRAKKYGWGWGLPLTWQGWVVYIGYFIFITLLFSAAENNYLVIFNIPVVVHIPLFIATVILIIITYLTGEKPKWRWGDK